MKKSDEYVFYAIWAECTIAYRDYPAGYQAMHVGTYKSCIERAMGLSGKMELTPEEIDGLSSEGIYDTGDFKICLEPIESLSSDATYRLTHGSNKWTVQHGLVNQEAIDSAATLMDDELREELHRTLAPCTPYEFLEAYKARHLIVFEEEFTY